MWYTILSLLLPLALPQAHARAIGTILENIDQLPEGWALQSSFDTSSPSSAPEADAVPPPDLPFSISLAIRHPGTTTLKNRLDEISDPSHPDYGRFLSREEVAALRTPDANATDTVLSWLADEGITGAVAVNDWVRFNTTIGDAGRLLRADLRFYSYRGGRPLVRARQYAVPGRVAEVVSFVHPIANFMVPSRGNGEAESKMERERGHVLSRRQEGDGAGSGILDDPDDGSTFPCEDATTPACIRELYDLHYRTPDNTSAVRFTIAGFLEQNLYHEDTKAFMAKFAPWVPDSARTVPIILTNGATDPQTAPDAGMEASLDLQYGLALGYPAQVSYILTGGRSPYLDSAGNPISGGDNEPYLEFLEYLLSLDDDKIPHVVSISYADTEQTLPREYALRACDMFASAAARGITFVVATGDGGARGTSVGGTCVTNDGSYREEMMVTFPASCPYVTAIGAVENAVRPPEAARYSTGGFSSIFDRPKWQDRDIVSYLSHSNVTRGREEMYRVAGRTIPDISAVGSSFQIVVGGVATSIKGTSASTPVIGAMFALAVDARLRAGKTPLGWVNPALYCDGVRHVWRDVVEGESYSCTRGNGDVPGGWLAVEGYDCVTGLGVPGRFGDVVDALVRLP